MKTKLRRSPAQILACIPLPSVPGDKRAKRNDLSESEIQDAVLDLLARHPAVAWRCRIMASSGRLVGRDGPTQYMQFAPKGCSDIIGQMKDGRFLAVECKTYDGTLSDEQAVFLARVNENHGIGFVARCAEDVMRYIQERTSK